jgi:hypothetical protein
MADVWMRFIEGAVVVRDGMALLGVSDLSADTYEEAKT